MASFKKLNCPICGKELIRLEPFENRLYEFGCSDCDIDIRISECELERGENNEVLSND